MISKTDIKRLYEWALNTNFPLRKEGITSKYMGYDVHISYVKYGKKNKSYRHKLINDEIFNIIKNEDIYGVAYLKYPPHVNAEPHRDFNLWGKDFLRVQLPLKLPQGKKCYIEWIDTGERVYWEEGKVEIFNVENLHKGKNNSDESMEFLYIDINPETKIEL